MSLENMLPNVAERWIMSDSATEAWIKIKASVNSKYPNDHLLSTEELSQNRVRLMLERFTVVSKDLYLLSYPDPWRISGSL